MIYSPDLYNPVVKRLSNTAKARLWTGLIGGFLIAMIFIITLVSSVSNLAAVSYGGSDMLPMEAIGSGIALALVFLLAVLLGLTMLILFIVWFIRLYSFRSVLYDEDRKSVSLLIASVWISIAVGVLGGISTSISLAATATEAVAYMDRGYAAQSMSGLPVVAVIFSCLSMLGGLAALILELVGYARLRKSDTLYFETANGFGSLLTADVLMISLVVLVFIAAIISAALKSPAVIVIFGFIALVMSIVALVLQFVGWGRIGRPAPRE